MSVDNPSDRIRPFGTTPVSNGYVPRTVGLAAEAVVAARGQPERLARVFDRSSVPLVKVDRERRYVDVNRPARLVFRLTLEELRALRIEDLTPVEFHEVLEPTWERLVAMGCLAGSWAVQGPDGGHLPIVYYGLADALPGLHVIAFAPTGWTDSELGLVNNGGPDASRQLTPRELDLLQLAAEGLSGPQIAGRLMLSAATVKTHFENIYKKLGVPDRVAAVAAAMRLGLID